MLTKIPLELLEKVAFELGADDFYGPPSALLPLLRTCKQIYNALRIGNCNSLYARIYRAKFDCGAAARRTGSNAEWNENLAIQLVMNCQTLAHIGSGEIYHDATDQTFMLAYHLLSQDDGKNKAQLLNAGVDEFAVEFVTQRLYDNREQANGWPIDNEINSYALWVMWMSTTPGTLHPFPIPACADPP